MARKQKFGTKRRARGDARRQRSDGNERAGSPWLYGTHAVLAALANPDRICERLLIADDDLADIAHATAELHGRNALIERTGHDDISEVLPTGAVHQNIALLAQPLEDPGIQTVIDRAGPDGRLVILDQVTDPHNVGAILRSAAAFGVTAVIMQDRHAPPVTGVLAKAASGALEAIDLVRETNLSRTLDTLKRNNFWCIGLDGSSEQNIAAAIVKGPVALVLGAEGSGMRRLVRESCDTLARIPQSGAVESLNVSNAAAVALYEITRETLTVAPPPPRAADTD
jgi:23S rRNA (guanosine2251-2'-O)-methyltransferase